MFVIRVKENFWVMEERGESRDLLNPKKYVELRDTGHFSFLDAPEKAADILKSYL